MKIVSIISTRPEIIKMAPVIREAEKRGVEHVFVATGQHYDFLLFDRIISDLELPAPDYNLAIGSGTPGLQVGIGMLLIEQMLEKEKPDIVLSEGDTNSVLSSALAAHKNGFVFGHVEAGLRSGDMTMPEEGNRVLTDHISNVLFAPTELSKKNLLAENIPAERIFVTGNTVVDAVHQHLPLAEKKSDILERLGLETGEYLLLTYHRAENTTKENLLKLADILNKIDLPIVYPIHPRTLHAIESHGLSEKFRGNRHLKMIEPAGYFDFLMLINNSRLILTDSGGLQEEATVLKVPTLVLRQNTERPEALGKGCELVHLDLEKILSFIGSPPVPAKVCPFGDGAAGKRIIELLEKTNLNRFKFIPSDMIR